MTRNPAAFGTRGTFALVASGFIAFIVLLAWLGTGEQPANTGGAHGQGKGIAGYAALATMLGADGAEVRFNRMPRHFGGGDLQIMTPLPGADAGDLAGRIRARRMGLGPTIVIIPKWRTESLIDDPRRPPRPFAALFGRARAPQGWTTIVGAGLPQWSGFLDHVGVSLSPHDGPLAHGWRRNNGTAGPLPDDRTVLSGGGQDDAGHPLVPLVRSGDGRILAGYFADGGAYRGLEAMAGSPAPGNNTTLRPLVLVFEPDLMNNRGLADRATAMNALRLAQAAMEGDSAGSAWPMPVEFDLSLAGIGQPRNLLTLAFAPPFLAATICLIMAMAGVIWRGFVRFGPVQYGAAANIAGKIALVGGGAGLVLRARRHRMMAGPYADACRERLQIALGLPHQRTAGETDAAIERIQQLVAPGTMPFGEAAARLSTARSAAAIAARAAVLHGIEQALAHGRTISSQKGQT
jgi:hypothetical protein